MDRRDAGPAGGLMVGVDTNVLLRWVLGDLDPDQSARVRAALTHADGDIHVCEVVLIEFVWLVDRRLRLPRGAQVRLIRSILENPAVVVARRDVVAAALTAFETGGAGFADHLIAALNRDAGCKTTLTFDKAAAQSPHFTEIA